MFVLTNVLMCLVVDHCNFYLGIWALHCPTKSKYG